MKRLFPLVAAFLILFISQTTISSCSKTVTKTDTVTKTVVDTVVKFPPNTVAGLLMGRQWIVDSLFTGYTATTKGTLAYSRGGSGNVQNLDNYIVIFWPDGTQAFANTGTNTYNTYTYSFQSSDSLNLRINNPNTDYARIMELNTKHLTIYDSTNSALFYYDYKP